MTPRQRFVSTLLGVLAGTVAAAGTLAVAAAGFTLSFDAIKAVGISSHIRPSLAWMLPITVDGAMSTAAVCAVVLKRMGRSAWYPWMVVVTGAGISVAANALHAYQAGGTRPLPAEWAMAVSAVPPVLLALSVHLLVILAEAVRGTEEAELSPAQRRTRRELGELAGVSDETVARWTNARSTPATNVARADLEAQPAPAPLAADPVEERASWQCFNCQRRFEATENVCPRCGGFGTNRQPVPTAVVDEPAPATGSKPRNGHGRKRGDAAAKVTQAAMAAPNASVAELARLAGVSRATVRRHNGHQVGGDVAT